MTGDARIGTDTLRSVEAVRGTAFADTFDATGFTASSTNAGSAGVNASGAAFNEFEGLGGNDTITGNGNTRISYVNALAGVTVIMTSVGAGTAHGTDPGDIAGVGTDTFTGVSAVRGSDFADVFVGSANPAGTAENFDGRGGNDVINGDGGFDRAIYNGDGNVTAGISVALAAGIVTGDAAVGTDTLMSVEAIRGTDFADTYNAAGFTSDTARDAQRKRRQRQQLQRIRGHGRQRHDHRQRQHPCQLRQRHRRRDGHARSKRIGHRHRRCLGRNRHVRQRCLARPRLRLCRHDLRQWRKQLSRRPGRQRHADRRSRGSTISSTAAVNDGLDHITDFSGHGGQNDVLDFDHLAFGNGLAVGGADTGTLDASHFVANRST